MPTQTGIDNAEWTQPYDSSIIRTDTGVLVEQIRDLPWAFVRFADAGEERKYIVPTNGALWISAAGVPVAKIMYREAMPYLPFPLETAKPAGTFGGAWAVHQFGWV